jgi:hypothetical protein
VPEGIYGIVVLLQGNQRDAEIVVSLRKIREICYGSAKLPYSAFLIAVARQFDTLVVVLVRIIQRMRSGIAIQHNDNSRICVPADQTYRKSQKQNSYRAQTIWPPVHGVHLLIRAFCSRAALETEF